MLKRPSKQDYVSAEHYASALQIYIDVKESALQSQIDRLTKERDEARLTAERLLDENTNLLNGLKAGNAHVDVLFVRGKLSWEDKTDE